MKEKVQELLNANLKAFKQDGANNLNLFKEIKVIDELNPGLIDSLGWAECYYTCCYFPVADLELVFDSFRSFERKTPSAVVNKNTLSELPTKVIYFDEENKCHFFNASEPSIKIWKNLNEDKLVLTSSNSLKGGIFTTNVARHSKFHSAFDTGFLDHSSAERKNFIVPKGECFGIEIEMLFATVFGKLRFSHWMKNNYQGWICERDGSLEDRGEAGDCGLELVSPPLDFKNLSEQLKIICAEALKHGGRGHDAGIWYGMHINVNIHGNNTDTTAAKFICLINDPNLRPFWQKVCRRRGASVERFCQFQNVNLHDCLITESENHYRATFYRRGKNCVEVRIFRSNLRHLTVKVSVEILKHTLDFCRGNDKFNDYIKYRDYLTNNGSNDLQEYLYHMKAMPELDKLVSNLTHEKFGQGNIANYIA